MMQMATTATTRVAQSKTSLRPSATAANGKLLNERELSRGKTAPAQEQLDTLRREHNKLQQAIYEAAQVQRTLCAPRELLWGDFQIAGELFPLRHLSGDFFKVTELGSSLGIIVGDIAGKGLTAGIWHAHLLAISQRCARSNSDPAGAVTAMNRELWLDQSEPPLTALFFATLDPQSNELAYCNAGLPAPLVLREGKAPERLEEGGPMLGAIQGATYKFGKTRIHSGDMLIAYSDGVTECCNAQDQEFGNDRLLATANAVRGSNANLALFSILATVLDFADVCSASDDLSLLVVRRREAPAAQLNQPVRKSDFSADRRPPSHARPKNAGRRGNSSRQLN